MKTTFFFLFFFLISLGCITTVFAHSSLDFVSIEVDKHLHPPTILAGLTIVLLLIVLTIQIIVWKKKKEKNNLLRYITIILILLIIGTTIALLILNAKEEKEKEASLEAFQPNGKIVEINITSFNFGYDPNTITVSAGDTVRITIDNIDFTHSFSVYELGVNEILYPKSISTVEFIAIKRGEFPIFCAIEGHRISGMKGLLIVQ